MSTAPWLASLKLKGCTLDVQEQGEELVVRVDFGSSDKKVNVLKRGRGVELRVESDRPETDDPEVDVAVGDFVKILVESPNGIVPDGTDSECDEALTEGFALVTSIDTEAETFMGLWIYLKQELPGGAARLVGRSEAVLTTDPFVDSVSTDSILRVEKPEKLHPQVMVYGTKRLDARMTAATLSGILTTAGHRQAPKRRKMGSIFDLPGHASQYKARYDAADADKQAEMAALAALLYTIPDDDDWDAHINELNVFAQRLDAAARSV